MYISLYSDFMCQRAIFDTNGYFRYAYPEDKVGIITILIVSDLIISFFLSFVN